MEFPKFRQFKVQMDESCFTEVLINIFFVKSHDFLTSIFTEILPLREISNVFTFQNVKAKVETIFFQLFFKFIARFWVASSSRKNLKDIFVFQISFTAAFKVWRENCKIFWQIAAHNLQKTLIILSPFWCSDPNHCNIIRNS